MKIVVTISGDQVIINDPATDYHHDTLTEWIDQARRVLCVGDSEMHLTTDTELAADDDTVDEPDDHIGFRP